ncbi:DNA ligase D [Flavobacterium algicola]|uniref:DNA ligase D n=1 Tax=Flavobacterium algicola TaxID=556529 RepID=UPI001EFECB15|nr:DNA ligase D [Flavobacterium algicola]MCG9790873.1 DNA ligase D [Flavobacterium algicola]
MSLKKYNEKRDFDQTKEPKGKIKSSKKELVFVVQKHAASHLHYDFRLEMDGVLKSWAIPKGPSLNPDIKHLAILVEDHPYDYKNFEGAIPKGNYGAGHVIVWDKGTYSPIENENSEENEKLILNGFKKGHLSFTLHGEKLNGEFSLIKLKGKQENAWLLIKKEDSFASTEEILKNDTSVLSGLTLDQLAKNEKSLTSIDLTSENEPMEIAFQSPILATTATTAFDNKEWIFEKKYDGYRTIAVIDKNEINLFSRNQQLLSKDFQPITDDLKNINHSVIIDGEVVIEDENGQSNFQMLQNYIKTGKGELKYYVFDLLNLDHNDLRNLKLIERKELLQLLLEQNKLSKTFYSKHIEEKGIAFFEKSTELKEEGIMAKKATSTYLTGKRTADWLKIKNHLQDEAVIVGITKSKNVTDTFGALLLAQYSNTNLKYIGKCGSGFTQQSLKDLFNTFQPYFTDKSPLPEKISIREEIQWLVPHFVCSVKFSQWTNNKRLRHPVFLGIRTDKNLKDITTEDQTDNIENQLESTKKDKFQKGNTNLEVKIGGQVLKLTNLNKIYFPEQGISKGEIIHYYSEITELILPYLKDRPESLNRFPNGIDSPNFYQKDIDTDKVPSWLATQKIVSDSNKSEIDYLICNDKETLIYMVNLGCIDFNPWNSTIQNLDKPDWMVIDIDPDNDNFQEVIETALKVREVLDNLEVESYCKTSGASGMHVYVPLAGKYSYESVKIFANIVAREVQSGLPDITTLNRSIKKRNHKIYIDYLQNRKGQTIAAPYSVRPHVRATVSTPLEWSELNNTLRPSNFTIKNVLKRFEKKGDIWKPVLGDGIDMKSIIEKYNA